MHDHDHPLLAELASLRTTAARFQHEAHTAALRLQRHALESAHVHEHAAALEQENARLAHELDVLRAHPPLQHHPAVTQVQELSLALRRVSDKITLTEDTLLQRTSELTDARGELARARHAADAAYELAARIRAREEAAMARERELELRARASDEERKMVDLVVQEYADLVRNLEGRRSVTTPTTLTHALQDAKSALHAALSNESDRLHATIAELNAQVSDLQMTLETERHAASHDRTLLSQTKIELDKLTLEDQTAAKMVARYMKFSQSCTNALQEQITTLKTRHASTVATFELQLSIAESHLASERAQTARLQDALDELCQDLARESYGRRREVALRLALLSREESVAEVMRRWARRARELYARCYDSSSPEDPVQEAFHRVVSDAESLLSDLDDDVQISDTTRASGSLARMALSRDAVNALRSELQDEVQKRMEAVRKLSLQNGDLDASDVEDNLQPDGTLSEQLLLTPNGDANPAHDTSPVPIVNSLDDPFLAPPSIAEDTKGDLHSLLSPSIQNSASTSATLLVDEVVPTQSPAVSTLELQQDLKPLATDAILPKDITPSPPPEGDQNVPLEEAMPILSSSISTPTPPPALDVSSSPPTPLSEIATTKHRYDTLQRAFRDCSLALKDLKRTLGSSSPSTHTSFRQHLDIALARIDDYAEDARVELEIRVADEELTARGFETVLSVPGALAEDGRLELEASARAFVDGTEEGVQRAMERFGRKLEDVEHDVAMVKRAVHELAMIDGEVDDDDGNKDEGSSWTAWTAGLLGTTTPTRSPTPVQTFGAVMTSPRLQHKTSFQQMRGSIEEADQGPLAGLNLRIPMPLSLPAPSSLGLGRAMDGRTGVRTMSAMYAVGGLRSASSIALGVGLGSSPSPARRAQGGAFSASSPSPLRGGRSDDDDIRHDLGGVE